MLKEALALAGAAALLLVAGCSSTGTGSAATEKGYIDFVVRDIPDPYLEIRRQNPANKTFEVVYSRIAPVKGGTLRLKAPSGQQRYSVWIINRITTGPVECDLEVAPRKVTSVIVTAEAAGTSLVESKEARGVGGRAKGGFGRSTRLTVDANAKLEISLAPRPPQALQPVESMGY